MSLSESFALAQQTVPSRVNNPCTIYKIKQSISADDASFLDKILYDKTVPPRVVVQTLANAKLENISDQIVRRHRLGQCATCGQA